ncbi:hypothetical protein [Colwellia sp. 20A7]|uniref:hypothetical protein n=1 Tax=Colwellia sp. 20A7 TaxID=2689569 RepID=UPI001357DB1B|nr:hypothetical protein [Colwellia sp. 20A7]
MKKTLATLMIAALSLNSAAQTARDDIISCYEYADIKDQKPSTYQRDVVVMLDQTVNLDTNLKKSVHMQVEQLLKSGDRIRIVPFSANAQGRYTGVTFDGTFDTGLTEDQSNAMNRIKLNKFHSCMEKQANIAIRLVHEKLKESFHDSEQIYPKTELAGTLMSVSKTLFSDEYKGRKILILISDMIENSDVSSFYSNGRVRVIDADTEFAKYSLLIPENALSSVEVFIIGGGYVMGGKAYSSQAVLNSLKDFWAKIVVKAGGELSAFGTPQLLNNIK